MRESEVIFLESVWVGIIEGLAAGSVSREALTTHFVEAMGGEIPIDE